MSVQVEVVSPQRVLFSGEVRMVSVPATDGYMGIMGRHAPLLSTLSIGEIILHEENGEQTSIAISGGVVEVRPNKVIILADVGEAAEDIDEDRAQAALERAKESLASNPPPEERAPLIESIRRSNLRLKVARKRRRSSSTPFSNN